MQRLLRPAALVVLLGALFAGGVTAWARGQRSFLATLGPAPALSAGTSPATGPAAGDANPYGVAVVPPGFPGDGALRPGDIIVSNFNNSSGLQGTGTSIEAVSPSGQTSTFFTAPSPTAADAIGPVGLTTALVALPSGLVIVGNTPAIDNGATVLNGSLIFLDEHGAILLNLTDDALLQGPWDMTADVSDPGNPILYVSDVLSGTVTRIDLHVARMAGKLMPVVESMTQIGSGFSHEPNAAALVLGPTGLLLSHDGRTLYVADTGNNRVQVLHDVRSATGDQGAGRTVLANGPLNGPLALAWSPDGTVIVSNGDALLPAGPSTPQPNLVVEFDPSNGKVIATRQLDTSGTPGGIFGIAVAPLSGSTSLIFVDDNTNTVNVLAP